MGPVITPAERPAQILTPCTLAQAGPLRLAQVCCFTNEVKQARRVARRGCSRPAPEELDVRVSPHPTYFKPELLATGPNKVWSWDITKPKGPLKWTYFQLYVILDIFSRYVVGWLIAPRESAELARQLIAKTVAKQGVEPRTLTVHAGRGTSMRSKLVAELLVDLDVAKSHSRPYVSDDNPFSEAQFKTLKYRTDFPERFGSIELLKRQGVRVVLS